MRLCNLRGGEKQDSMESDAKEGVRSNSEGITNNDKCCRWVSPKEGKLEFAQNRASLPTKVVLSVER